VIASLRILSKGDGALAGVDFDAYRKWRCLRAASARMYRPQDRQSFPLLFVTVLMIHAFLPLALIRCSRQILRNNFALTLRTLLDEKWGLCLLHIEQDMLAFTRASSLQLR
jgi:hypothetical protein